ncbi:MAG: ribonuclease HII [Bacteroidota bacterium]
MKIIPSLNFEKRYWNKGIEFIAGIDEAGRGPLAGPVVAAAVILPKNIEIKNIRDSKKLSAKKRDELYLEIHEVAISIGIGLVDHIKIDEVNILEATKIAMTIAVERLKVKPQQLLIDGNFYSHQSISVQNIVQGDLNVQSIAAASIIAKVTRDALMNEYDIEFPNYGFAKHKGYGTRKHVEAIHKHGLTKIHRRSFHIPDYNFNEQ